MKRNIAIILTILSLAGLVVPLSSCGSQSAQAEDSGNQVVTVERGDIGLEINAAGNLALSQVEDLAFDIFYSEATVEAVLVDAGDQVTEGQELVKLDTSEWDDELNTLKKELVTAKRNLATAESQIATKELAVRSAELDVDEAQDELYQTDELKGEYDSVETAKFELRVAQETADWETIQYWQARLTQAQADLDAAMDELNLTDPDDAELELAKSMLKYDQSQKALDDAKLDLEDANLDLEDAKQNVEDVQSDLDEAESLSPIITAPFDGFVTKVNVEGGDEVLKGTVAVQVADPNKFEAEILVSELDISQVELGGDAVVQVDATELSLPAEVTYIAPTATISSGVVNYSVVVEVQFIPEDAYLKEGMTVTVSLIVSERQDVLLVPYSAITTEGEQKYVQVVSADGTIEKRAISTGITDYEYTEVTDGLSEGEQVLASQWTATTPSESTSTAQESQGGMMMPGMGGGPPGG